MSSFYKRHSLQIRIAMMFSATSLAGAFSGLLAAGIENMDGNRNLPGWAWIFILVMPFSITMLLIADVKICSGGSIHHLLWLHILFSSSSQPRWNFDAYSGGGQSVPNHAAFRLERWRTARTICILKCGRCIPLSFRHINEHSFILQWCVFAFSPTNELKE